MNLYAIRDRLLEYFMTPFVADGDKQVMHGLAALINTGAKDHAIAQAPHHFELWRLAEIDEDTGTCKGPPTFLADASSLVREGVRSERVPGTPDRAGAATPSQDSPGRPGGLTGARRGSPEGPQGAETLQAP